MWWDTIVLGAGVPPATMGRSDRLRERYDDAAAG